MNHYPLVSIIMTAYNREKYISEAIESVLNNDYYNYELIIVDDNSSDKTVDIINSYITKSNKIKFYRNEINLGDYPNRNKAVSYASGEYLLFVDSDDKLFPNSVVQIIKDISNDPNFNFAMYWPHNQNKFYLSGDDALRKHFFEQQFLYMGPGGTFMKRDFFLTIGGYPEKYGPANDMYFNLKVCCNSIIWLLPYEFVFYRRHEGQEINNRFSYMHNNYSYMKDVLLELNLPFSKKEKRWLIKKNKRRFTIHLFQYFIKTRNIKKTIEAYKRAEFNFLYIIQGIFQ